LADIELGLRQKSATFAGVEMADVMAIVRKDVFEDYDRRDGPLVPGSGPLSWSDYQSDHPLLDEYLDDGDRIFLVTARPQGQLWLVAVYEDVKRLRGGWFAREDNRTSIVDITDLRSKFRFHSGNGLTIDDAKLGQSLQNPRKLTRADIALLERALKKQNHRIKPAKVALDEEEADEGRRLWYEAERFKRDPSLVRGRLKKDDYRCAHCGFTVDAKYFPTELRSMSRVVHVHHIRPLLDGRRKTKLTDLVTLCPTCHAVAHAIATSLTKRLVSVALLKKHYHPR
jgi:hypothetical protein